MGDNFLKGAMWGTPLIVLSLLLGMPQGYAASQAGTVVTNPDFSQKLAKAKAGDVRAQYDLARSYQTGVNGVVDEEKAIFWLYIPFGYCSTTLFLSQPSYSWYFFFLTLQFPFNSLQSFFCLHPSTEI